MDMFHMLTCFNLKPNYTLDDFRRSITDFTEHMQASDLVHSTGPIGHRQSDTIMDTDSERNHEYFFLALQPTPSGVGAGCAGHAPCGAAELSR
jgi:hypothetical protein